MLERDFTISPNRHLHDGNDSVLSAGSDDRMALQEFQPTKAGTRFIDLNLSLDGYEGPIDLLLSLAREHKIDLTKLAILPLALQYLAFIRRALRQEFELSAEYLVMAAWLGYLKSRLLLPDPPQEETEEDSAQYQAMQLIHHLNQLKAMQEAAQNLLARPRLQVDFFARPGPPNDASLAGQNDGQNAGLSETEPSQAHFETWAEQAFQGLAARQAKQQWQLSFQGLLIAYAQIAKRRQGRKPLTIMPTKLYALDQALTRLRHLVGHVPQWTELLHFLPDLALEQDGLVRRSMVAASFLACLELAREHVIELQQTKAFAPLTIRSSPVAAHGQSS